MPERMHVPAFRLAKLVIFCQQPQKSIYNVYFRLESVSLMRSATALKPVSATRGLTAEVTACGVAVGRREYALGGERAHDVGDGVAHLRTLPVVQLGIGGAFGA